MACSFEFEKEEHLLKPEIIAEASLSLEHPIVAKPIMFGSVLAQKKSFISQACNSGKSKRIQDGIAYTRSGNGVKRKQKALFKTKIWKADT